MSANPDSAISTRWQVLASPISFDRWVKATLRQATRWLSSVIFSSRRLLSLSLEAAQPSTTDPSLDVAWAADGRAGVLGATDAYSRRLLIQSSACYGASRLNGARTCSASGHVILNAMQSKHNAPTLLLLTVTWANQLSLSIKLSVFFIIQQVETTRLNPTQCKTELISFVYLSQ